MTTAACRNDHHPKCSGGLFSEHACDCPCHQAARQAQLQADEDWYDDGHGAEIERATARLLGDD